MKFFIPMAMMITMTPTNSKLVFSLMIILFNTMMQKMETSKISYIFMGDLMSFWTTNLTLWISFAMMFMNVNSSKAFNKFLMSISMVLSITFFVWDLMAFYIAFEISMIIILLMIMSWGYQPERVEAAIFMLMMALITSLPLISMLMMNMNNLSFWFMSTTTKLWDYLSLLAIFMMKMPTFFLHLWLPKVHVESPTHGSMILAAIMLKLGSYGLIRTAEIAKMVNSKFAHMFMAFSLWTMLLMSITCFLQTDMKTIIAYSSIVHMTLVFSTIMLNKSKGMAGSILMMVGHGMCSSGLFFMASMMYKTTKSRSMIMNKGVLGLTPLLSNMWFILCMSNAPMPPSMNVVGEFLCFKAVINWLATTMGMAGVVMFFSSLYSIYLFYLPCHGMISKSMTKVAPASEKSFTILMLHMIPLIMMSIKIQIIMV